MLSKPLTKEQRSALLSLARQKFREQHKPKRNEGCENKFGTEDVSRYTDADWVRFLTELQKMDPQFRNPIVAKKLATHQANITKGIIKIR